jgi:hypothetical protein
MTLVEVPRFPKRCGHCDLRAFAAAVFPISIRFLTRDWIEEPECEREFELESIGSEMTGQSLVVNDASGCVLVPAIFTAYAA